MRKLAASCVMLLTACNAGDIGVAAPPTYKDLVAREIKSTLKDPYSVRGAEISEPAAIVGAAQGVCVKFNAKNSYGAYQGVETKAFVFREGKPLSVLGSACGAQRYSPFPELGAPS